MIGRILRKGPRVIAYRAWQSGRLQWLQRSGYWPRLDQRASTFWNPRKCELWLRSARNDRFFIGPSHLAAVRAWADSQPAWRSDLVEHVQEIRAGHISIFDQTYPFQLDALPWHTDWRWDHTWPPAPCSSYRFYIHEKPCAYDVKFPWELSRLSFLLPVVQAAVLGEEDGTVAIVASIVAQWTRSNPVAHSVNWAPMECSMRAINLVLIALMLASDSRTTAESLQPILQALIVHGEFLWRRIEYTDVRGNHYAANLVALLLLGAVLDAVYRPAVRWTHYARTRIGPEILLQYCSDGVNFEKSVAYHRLVTELYLLSLIVMDHRGYAVSQDARDRIHRACEYTLAYMRPDGWAPNWGDNDSACVLDFDQRPLRDHRELLALAAAFFADPAYKTGPSSSVAWLLGSRGVCDWDALQDDVQAMPRTRWFEAGGMLVAHAEQNYLFADYGEVGMHGRGGHGHNDTFSFELCLAGVPLIIDSGSPTYTGDLKLCGYYRGTAAHNTLRIDETEMATMIGSWRIGDDARPRDVHAIIGEERDTISGEHAGYARLADPVIHRRSLTFDKVVGHLNCSDHLQCNGAHRVERFLHIAPDVEVELRDDELHMTVKDRVAAICRWNTGARARIEPVSISYNYGEETGSYCLILTDTIAGDSQLSFDILLERPIHL